MPGPMTQKVLRDCRLFALAVTLFPAVAQAYIDPGFGALVWQAAVAAVIGAMFFLRSTIAASFRWVRVKISGVPAKTEKQDPAERPTEQG